MNKNENKKIDNISDLINILDKQTFDEGAPRYYYRGETNFDRPLLPQLARNRILLGKDKVFSLINDKLASKAENKNTFFNLQFRLLQKLKRYAVHMYRQNNRPWQGEEPSDWEWLCVAQHHGLPTLLSDWTINPLVALFFSALSEESDGVFYSMRLKNKHCREDETIRVGQNEEAIEDETKEINQNDRNSIRNKSDFSLKNIDKPVIVVPLVFTRRIETQSARFVYFGHLSKEKIPCRKELSNCKDPKKEFFFEKAIDKFENTTDSINPWTEIIPHRVPRKSKQKILRQLRSAQIHHGTLFPDLDGYSDYLRLGGI